MLSNEVQGCSSTRCRRPEVADPFVECEERPFLDACVIENDRVGLAVELLFVDRIGVVSCHAEIPRISTGMFSSSLKRIQSRLRDQGQERLFVGELGRVGQGGVDVHGP